MEQKRVSFKVAKAIKEVGYPQEGCDEYLNKYGAIDSYLGYNIARPYAMEVWLWLWKVKDIKLSVAEIDDVVKAYIRGTKPLISQFSADPEEAIIAVIEYLCENDLIR